MTRLTPVDLDDLNGVHRQDVLDDVRQKDGTVDDHFRVEGNAPYILTTMYDLQASILSRSEIETEMLVKVALAVSMANLCTYCTGAYGKLLSSHLGSDRAVWQYQLALTRGELDGKEEDLVEFALTVLVSPAELTDDDFASLREDYGFDDAAFVELLYMVNIVAGYNRVTLSAALSYDHDFPKRWADVKQYENDVAYR